MRVAETGAGVMRSAPVAACAANEQASVTATVRRSQWAIPW